MDTELLALRARSLIADKEMWTAQANHDLQRFDEWRCDYAAAHVEIDAELKEVFEAMRRQNRMSEEGITEQDVRETTPDPPRDIL